MSDRLLDRLIWPLVRQHPLPWLIEFDWTVEVYDRNGKIVLKCMTEDEARELITRAESLMVSTDEC